MSRELTFSLYNHRFDTATRLVSATWDAWAGSMLEHQVRGRPEDTDDLAALDRNKDGEGFIPGPVDGPRCKANVREIQAAGLDLEGVTEDQLLGLLRPFLSFEFVLYSTHKSGARCKGGLPRVRLIFPLETPYPAGRHLEVWSRVNGMAGGRNDPQTKDASRIYYVPTTFDPAHAVAWRNRGRWLSVADLPELDHDPREGAASEMRVEKVRQQLRSLAASHPLKGAAAALLCDGKFAEPGERHDAILRLTWWIADKSPGLADGDVEELFRKSFLATYPEEPGHPLKEAVDGYRGALARIEEKRRERASVLQLSTSNGSGPYSAADLAAIAAAQGCQAGDLKTRWVVQRDGACWFLGPDGSYLGPYQKDDALVRCRQVLSRAPVDLVKATQSGASWLPLADVVTRHGSVADRVVVDLTAERNRYDDARRTMHEATCPVRNLGAEYSHKVNAWLQVLGGPHYGKLVDWLSCLPKLDSLVCAVYFGGTPGAGKTILADGAAKIWHDGPPTLLKNVIGDFNEDVSRCPLIFADEKLPRKQQEEVTSDLREMISVKSRPLCRKFRTNVPMLGAVRVILSANNAMLLESSDMRTRDDLDAVAARFLYLRAPPEAARYIESLEQAERDRWNEGCGIARHVLWLAENHEIVSRGKRFVVEGDLSRMHRLLATSESWTTMVGEFLIRYCLHPNPVDVKEDGLIRRGDGKLLVNDQAVIDNWTQYLRTHKDPDTRRIANALRSLSNPTKRVQLRWKGKAIRYRQVDTEQLKAISDDINVGSHREIDEAIGAVEKAADAVDQTTDDLATLPAVNEGGAPM